MTPTQLRRSFINQFLDPKKSHHLAPRPFALTRLIQRFDATGGVTGRLKDPETVITLENIEIVKQYFTEKPRCGIREGCSELDLSYTTIWRILRKHLHWKAYKPRRVTKLTDKNKNDRVEFCNWLLSKEEGFETNVIFSDGKWFVLHPAPNSQNERIWAPRYPQEEVECRYQGDQKIMVWAGLVDGPVLMVRWMINDGGGPVSVTAEKYLAVIKENVWSEVRPRAAQLQCWWQQEGFLDREFLWACFISAFWKRLAGLLSRYKPTSLFFLALRDVTGEENKTSNYWRTEKCCRRHCANNTAGNLRKRCEACLDILRELWNPCKIGAYFQLLYIFKIFELVVIFQEILVFKTPLAWTTLYYKESDKYTQNRCHRESANRWRHFENISSSYVSVNCVLQIELISITNI